MKKILWMAVAALMFVACNENGPSSADKKSANVVSSEAVELLGQDLAKVDKALTDAGYVKTDGGAAAKTAPARVRALAAKAEAQMAALYVYGLPAEIGKMSEAEADACMTKAVQDGKTIAMAYVVSEDGKLAAIQTTMYLKLTSGVNKLYTDVSNKLYDEIPAGAIPETPQTEMPSNFPYSIWAGYVSLDYNSSEEEGEVLETTDHAELVAKIAANKSLMAGEFSYTYTNQEGAGWMYRTMWVNPTEEEQQEMQKEIGAVVAYGTFVVADNNSTMNMDLID